MLPVRYVVMETTSQRIGDWNRPWMNTFMIRSGRPMSISTIGAPTIRAKTVIASAMRVMGRRQPASVTLRIAEISVPAWLIPMKKTKFAM